MLLGEPHTYMWVYMALGTTTPPGNPTECSMDTYSILWQVNSQRLMCVTYTLYLLISQIWHFLRLSPKLEQKRFGNISEMFHSRQWYTDYLSDGFHHGIEGAPLSEVKSWIGDCPIMTKMDAFCNTCNISTSQHKGNQ